MNESEKLVIEGKQARLITIPLDKNGPPVKTLTALVNPNRTVTLSINGARGGVLATDIDIDIDLLLSFADNVRSLGRR